MTTDPATGQTTYEARQGSKRLELVVGSMALQVSKGGKPVENVLYKDMAGWQHEDGKQVVIRLNDRPKPLTYQTDRAADITAAV